jgi:hypothetical protein
MKNDLALERKNIPEVNQTFDFGLKQRDTEFNFQGESLTAPDSPILW